MWYYLLASTHDVSPGAFVCQAQRFTWCCTICCDDAVHALVIGACLHRYSTTLLAPRQALCAQQYWNPAQVL
jgi:hypothetical protein